jgi:hypothetical protein
MRIQHDDSVGIFIDIQEKLFPVMFDPSTLEKNVSILLKGLDVLQVPNIITQQYTKGLGDTIPSLRESCKHFSYIEKKTFSCCDEPEFMSRLTTFRKKYVIIAGIEAHVCILQTVIDLLDRQYTPVIVTDCISSRKDHDKAAAINRFISEGAIVTTYESILFELCRVSGTDEFKKISGLIK